MRWATVDGCIGAELLSGCPALVKRFPRGGDGAERAEVSRPVTQPAESGDERGNGPTAGPSQDLRKDTKDTPYVCSVRCGNC